MKHSPTNRQLWLAALSQRIVWMRVAKVGMPVGILQAVINQGDVWWHHEATGLTLFKTVLSPLVTSSVALVSSAATWVERQRENELAVPVPSRKMETAGQLPAEMLN
ncbi:MAG TPA: hypothetical protein VK968_13345 [Roseimicrobium sp.]|nr:hypothetical protein [Roseimicrobium sp.]